MYPNIFLFYENLYFPTTGLSKPTTVTTVSPGTQTQSMVHEAHGQPQGSNCGPEDDPFGSAPFSMPLLIGAGSRKGSGGGGVAGGND